MNRQGPARYRPLRTLVIGRARSPAGSARARRRVAARAFVLWLVASPAAPAPASGAGAAGAGSSSYTSLAARFTDRFERAAAARAAGETGVARVLLSGLVVAPALPAPARARAYYLRGESWYRDGAPLSAAQDYARALEFDPDFAPARYALGYLFLRGEGVPADPAQAARQLTRAAREGHAGAQHNAGLLYLDGHGVAPEPERARRLLEDAAAQDHGPALTDLGRLLLGDALGAPEPARARAYLQRARALGHAPAATALAVHFEARAAEFRGPQGEEARRLRAEAVELYREGAAGGDPDAMTRLGWLHLQGEAGLAPDRKAARGWFERAAAADHPRGTAFLAWLHEGRSEPDRGRAAALYARAARLGDANARHRLTELGLARIREPGGSAEGLRWLHDAAAAGSLRAGNALAWIRATTPAAEHRDGRAAVRWARRVVEGARTPAHLDTLAAAYAEVGDFEAARRTQRAAIAALGTEDATRWRAVFDRRLAHYRSGRPWRDPGATESGIAADADTGAGGP